MLGPAGAGCARRLACRPERSCCSVVHWAPPWRRTWRESSRARRPAALILESPFRSVPDLAQRLYPLLPARWLSRFDYDTAAYVAQSEAPVLVIHSREDDIIPFAEGEAVHAAAPEPKRMLVIGGSHNTGFLESEAAYLAGIEAFLVEVAGLSAP
jgi:pimeloyl-ACP methyl ester carboxylesterase